MFKIRGTESRSAQVSAPMAGRHERATFSTKVELSVTRFRNFGSMLQERSDTERQI